ncbi:MAG: hypothetical protein ACYCS7_07435 [Acidimicrobiales bacterium]
MNRNLPLPLSGPDLSSSARHTSILKLVETKWNLPAINYRDANANNMLDFVDLVAKPAFLTPPTLATSGNSAAAAACLQTGPGQIPPVGAVT